MTDTTDRPRRRAQNRHVAARIAAHRIAAPYRAKLGELNAELARLRGHLAYGTSVQEELAEALREAQAEAQAFRDACRNAGVDLKSHSLLSDIDRGHRHLMEGLAALQIDPQ